MSDKLYPIPIERLLQWILTEEKQGQLFGIPQDLFFKSKPDDVFKIERYGQVLETPIGVAAGPHTQLAQNILAAWLVGARYIELKTVQTLDDINVSKPCIDMEDEGYNCEWSQELTLIQSFNEYLNAWVLIQVLKDKLGWRDDREPGFIFNMSVGYDWKGILKPNMQQFLDKMVNAGPELEAKLERLTNIYPRIRELHFNSQITNNITLSTMHGCPPDEIEKIGRYLIKERKLHTTIKLNPTLLGSERVRTILDEKLGFDVEVPEEAFDHDLKYSEALSLIRSLQESAQNTGVQFGLKLTNTLEVLNTKQSLPTDEKMIYLSGRALHPISINLAQKLQDDFNGELDISFSAGVDCFNVAEILACNIMPITTCSDILKPGGYARLGQYLKEIDSTIKSSGAQNIEEFILKQNAAGDDISYAGLRNLESYAERVLENKSYYKSSFPYHNIKTARPLLPFDCAYAPCVSACAVSQDVPSYIYFTAQGEYDKAYDVIVKTNPFPNVTGMVCDHKCQVKCTRMNYDNPLLIREIKRFIAERKSNNYRNKPVTKNGLNIAIIGAGPSGLACAYFLAKAGYKVEIFESKGFAGGLVSEVIPLFRLTTEAITGDLELIQSMGIQIHLNHTINQKRFKELRKKYGYVYIAVGAQQNRKLGIPGENASGVLDPLKFLSTVRQKQPCKLGPKVAVIGGGNSAMDAARTANRLVGRRGDVVVLYRRTRKEMPVAQDEVEALLEEGITLNELVTTVRIRSRKGIVKSLICAKMRLGTKDNSGRPRPIKIDGSEFEMLIDTVIPAIGQEVVLDFLSDQALPVDPVTNETQFTNIYAGGDVVRGADSLINAIGDGKKVAENIHRRAIKDSRVDCFKLDKDLNLIDHKKKQAKRKYGIPVPQSRLDRRSNFDPVHYTLDETSAQAEAARCLYCDEICNICVTVCPNLANVAFIAEPVEYQIQQVFQALGGMSIDDLETFRIEQRYQIINIGDFCNECGNCTTFCPTNGAPFRDKPRFYLTKESFKAEPEGYFISNGYLKYKSNGSLEILSIQGNEYVYESENIYATLDMKSLQIKKIRFKSEELQKFNTKHVAQMAVLLRNLKDF